MISPPRASGGPVLHVTPGSLETPTGLLLGTCPHQNQNRPAARPPSPPIYAIKVDSRKKRIRYSGQCGPSSPYSMPGYQKILKMVTFDHHSVTHSVRRQSHPSTKAPPSQMPYLRGVTSKYASIGRHGWREGRADGAEGCWIAFERAGTHTCVGAPKEFGGALEPPTPLGGQPERPGDAKTAAACLQDKQAAAVRSCPDEAHNQALRRAHTARNAQPLRFPLEVGIPSRAADELRCCLPRPRVHRRLGPRTSIPNASSPRRRAS